MGIDSFRDNIREAATSDTRQAHLWTANAREN